jgi:hypothetical protein
MRKQMPVNYIDPYDGECWTVTGNYSVAQDYLLLKAAPGVGKSFYITDVFYSNGGTTGSIKIVEDPAGTPVDVMAYTYMSTNTSTRTEFKTPIKMTANKALGLKSVTVSTHSITICGFIGS